MAKKPSTTKKALAVETATEVDPVERDEREVPASAGPTPEDQANDPKAAFKPDPDEAKAPTERVERLQDGHPSAGPTPEMQNYDPAPMFEPAPEPEVDEAVEPVPPVPSAGPTPEDIKRLDEEAAEGEKARKAAEKESASAKGANGRKAVEKLVADGILTKYVETASSPDDVQHMYTLSPQAR